MSVTTETLSEPAVSVEPPLWPITVEMYSAMIRSGILGEKDRVYLWNGRLAARMPPKRPHSVTMIRAYEGLRSVVPDGYHVEPEQPLALRLSHSAPQPDVMVLRGGLDDYLGEFPTTADVLLVVEVAVTSLAGDRKLASTYAAEGIPTYWIVNLPGRRIEVHSDPTGPSDAPAYRQRRDYGPGESIPVILDGREVGRIAVDDLLPDRPPRED